MVELRVASNIRVIGMEVIDLIQLESLELDVSSKSYDFSCVTA